MSFQLTPTNGSYPAARRNTAKQHTSPLTTGNVFKYTGSLVIHHIIGRITTVIQGQATTVKLSVVADALAAYDICTTKDLNALTVGTILTITGTAANAMLATDTIPSLAPGQAADIPVTCTASGFIKATYGAASTGAILWMCIWEPLTLDASLSPV